MPQDNPTISPKAYERTLEIKDLLGLLTTTTAVPAYVPKKFSEQIVVTVTGGSASLYVYDITNNQWRAATLGT